MEDGSLPLPTLEEVLVCNPDTTAEEVNSCFMNATLKCPLLPRVKYSLLKVRVFTVGVHDTHVVCIWRQIMVCNTHLLVPIIMHTSSVPYTLSFLQCCGNHVWFPG